MKKIKMVLYGEPGDGKSTFVSKAKNPFFITTDGNFEWLDLPDENHRQINSFAEFKMVLKEMIDNPEKYAAFDTIALDLVEDTFKWCEYEFCKKNRIEHVGDMGYGKGYDISRNEFYIEISKLLNLDKHVVLIAHGYTKVETTNRGVNITKYLPSQRIPDKVWDMIEGRVRYFLRVYSKDEEVENGKFVKRRYLSLIPKQGEYGIARGLDESVTPEDIILDWNTFLTVIGVSNEVEKQVKVEKQKPVKQPKTKEEVKVEEKPKVEEVKEEVVLEENKTEVPVKEEVKVEEVKIEETPAPIVEEEPKKEESFQEKIARIKAKNAALKAANK